MKYLGTAAAEGWPALFCDCDNCRRASSAGGRNLRTRSQALIDDRLLIDFPPDTLCHVHSHNLKLYNIHACLLTHSHGDHLYPADLNMRREGFAHFEPDEPLTFYGGAAAREATEDVIKRCNLERAERLRFQTVTAFEPFCAAGYVVTPLPAAHAPETTPFIFQITDGTKNILYANDSGWFPTETWDWLGKHAPRYDFISLDCTGGKLNSRRNHLGLNTCRETKDELIRLGCAGAGAVFCLHHFSHNGGLIYDELVPLAAECEMLVAFDGMKIEI